MQRRLPLLAVVLLLFAATWWSVSRPGSRARGGLQPVDSSETRAPDQGASLAPASTVTAATESVREPSSAPPSPAASPEPAPADEATWPVRGVVLDRRTGEPVPDFALQLVQPGQELFELAVQTDARGAFTTWSRFRRGEVRVFHDDASARESLEGFATHVLGGPEDVLTIEVEVGPTYEVEPLAPERLAPVQWFAALRGADEAASAVLPEHELTALRNPREKGGFAWVRFFPRPYGELARPWRLELVSRDGRYRGSAEVQSVVGIQPGVVPVPIEVLASVRIEARDTRQRSVHAAWVRLERTEGTRVVRREHWSLPEGGLVLRALEPGPWSLEIDSYDHALHRGEVRLVAGELTAHTALLEPLVGAGSVSGLVTSASGRLETSGEVALWPHEGSRANRRHPLQWEGPPEQRVARFRFDDVPAGTYELAWVAPECPFEVRPAARVLVTVPTIPPVESEFHVLDDAPTLPVEFRALDAVTGEALALAAWWRAPGGWARWSKQLEPGAIAIPAWPVGRELRWVVRAASGGLAHGDQHDLEREGERLVARVTLASGWSVQLFLQESGQPVEGVTLAFDGVPFGPSGEEGSLPLFLPRAPTTLEVRTPGWSLPGGAREGPAPAFDLENWWALALELERAPR